MEQYLLSSIRILMADDFKDWRRQVLSLFQARPEWQVIAEAADGPDAIQKAEELKPDLIVLDIGLPQLNGIEVARQIRQFSPNSRIVILSQNTNLDIVRAALSTGALGYVRKADSQSDLLLAVDAVLRGQQFVSSRLKGYKFTDNSAEKAPHRHEVLFYSDDTVLLDSLARFIAAALKAGNAAIVLATKPHRDSLVQRLKAEGVDTDDALQRGTYISLDAADTLSTIMDNDMPDPVRFFGGFGGLIEAAAKAAKPEQPQVVVFGEAVALLLAEGRADAAIRTTRKRSDQNTQCRYPVRICVGQLSRRGRRARFPEHLCTTLSRAFRVRSKTQFEANPPQRGRL